MMRICGHGLKQWMTQFMIVESYQYGRNGTAERAKFQFRPCRLRRHQL